MQIKFLGAAGTVTGSSYVLISQSGQSMLIDCGMFQGGPEIEKLNQLALDWDCSSLAGGVLTHAHLDHCGRLPLLVREGFTRNLWMTEPTRDLTELSLNDSAKVGKQDLGDNALYGKEDVRRIVRTFKTVGYDTVFSIGCFSIIMRDAGHILGSASLEITDLSATGEMKKIVFSGDLGNSPEPLLQPTVQIDSADAVVMESTYGDRIHPDEDPKAVLSSEIRSVEQNNGVLLIPAFSLERTQELLHFIGQAKMENLVEQDTTVILDSPMAERATDIYRRYPEFFNEALQSEFKTKDPFDFPGLAVALKPKDSRFIQKIPGTKVIIAGSGMMTGGRILGHAIQYLGKPSTRLLIVGFQAEDTLGRQILEGDKQVSIDGISVQVNASVNQSRGMSSHADQPRLVSWLKHIAGVKKVILTHGEDGPRTVLSEKISQDTGVSDIARPVLNQLLDVQ